VSQRAGTGVPVANRERRSEDARQVRAVQAVDGDDRYTNHALNHQLRYLTELTEPVNTLTRDELKEAIAFIQVGIDE